MRSGDHVLVACSGGSDSVALARILARLRTELGVSLAIASVDHGLRAEARAEVASVGALAEELGLPFEPLRVEVRSAGEGLQAAARDARYRALSEAAARLGASRIAVGHTLDDQAETVLAAVVRGKSLHALRGIAWRRPDGVVRPLLGQRRAVLRAWLVAGGHPFVEDPSNQDLRYERARLRAAWGALETLDPRVAEHLAALAVEARGASARLRRRGRLWRERARSGDGLRLSVLRAAATATRREVLRLWLAEGGVLAGGVLRELEAATQAERGEVRLAAGRLARVEGGCLVFVTTGRSGPTASRSEGVSD